jgi:tRNA pseudouridine55 synthase
VDINGIILINKEKGTVSHNVVQGVRRILSKSKVGHIGTLDPAATGLLPIMIGDANRLHIYMSKGKKKYTGTIFLGQSTDTYDSAGEPMSEFKDVCFEVAEIRDVLYDFSGVIEQVPPPYSAVKLNGKPLHKYAREGNLLHLKPRSVEIFSISLNSLEKNILSVTIICSQGTYIRSIANDIGAKLGCGAHLQSLERRAVGELDLSNAVRFDDFRDNPEENLYSGCFRPLDGLLPNLPVLKVLDEEARLFSCGGRIDFNPALYTPPDETSLNFYQKDDQSSVKVFFNTQMLGIGIIESRTWVRPATVFGAGIEKHLE